ncbi:Signal transduction histidine kinase CheA [Cystobacter fuscus DSM 2262]|uniref:histidine kinase n=1 Tax=Cystobacter fuscus (strain ATCC 25194 / DSM 2262 / NBRC 100088 / M29) TaxID=1242864 RepID=S9QDM6_CYSF2|nr:response regulator [Cystobacter fuscus]EPX59454.1 Signal transduction histidine kinase CheA [Cystobacter fuscus DSM 2262]
MSLESDPLLYFRIEARELLEQLTQGLLALDDGEGGAEAVPELFRYAHTLKGAARVVGQVRLAEMAHAVEDALSPYRDSGNLLPADSVHEFLRLVGQMAVALDALDAPPPAPEQEASQEESAIRLAEAPSSSSEVVRVELERLDTLLEGLSEAVVQLGGLRGVVESLAHAQQGANGLIEQLTSPVASSGTAAERARWLSRVLAVAEGIRSSLGKAGRQLGGGLGQVESELGRLRDGAHTLRLVPAQTLFGPLELAARDVASSLGRQVEVRAEGGDIQIDGHVLSAVRQALLHVVRNAVDHGLENPDERRALGKSPSGTFKLEVRRRGGRVSFLCEDDGRGVDLGRVRQVALERGVATLDEVETLDDAGLLELLFRPGFSTARSITDVSGRGVGLDVVRDTVRRLKGEVSISSRPGLGTSIQLEVPLTLASLEVLGVAAGGQRLLLPLESLGGALHLPGDAVTWTGGRGSISHEGEVLSFLPLVDALDSAGAGAQRPRAWSVLVLDAGTGGRAAVGVDKLLGISRRVSRPLPSTVPALPLVAGASFDEQGVPLLLLDAAGLVRRIQSGTTGGAPQVRPLTRHRVLVVDDSVTTRMLEKSILEAAGYQVELAASGEEGLEKIKRGGHSLLIVDVEMPGMSGLDVTRHLRATPEFQSLPILMVSSLATDEDLRRSREAGVSAYIVKGEFHQHRFLETVARLAAQGAAQGRRPVS